MMMTKDKMTKIVHGALARSYKRLLATRCETDEADMICDAQDVGREALIEEGLERKQEHAASSITRKAVLSWLDDNDGFNRRRIERDVKALSKSAIPRLAMLFPFGGSGK